jgi:hypothetical protein
MTALETIEAYLKQNPGMVYCDDCLSENLTIHPRQQVQQKTSCLAHSPSFERHSNLCACCHRPKLAIGAKAPKVTLAIEANHYAGQSGRLDRVDARLERIERHLELVDLDDLSPSR